MLNKALRHFDKKSTVSVKDVHKVLAEFKVKLTNQEVQGVFDANCNGFAMSSFELLSTLLPRAQAKRKWKECYGHDTEELKNLPNFERGHSREATLQLPPPKSPAMCILSPLQRSASAMSGLPSQRTQRSVQLTGRRSVRSGVSTQAGLPPELVYEYLQTQHSLPKMKAGAASQRSRQGMAHNPNDPHYAPSGELSIVEKMHTLPRAKIEYGIEHIRHKDFSNVKRATKPMMPYGGTTIQLWNRKHEKRPASMEGPPAALHEAEGQYVGEDRKEFWHEWHWRNQAAGRRFTKADKLPGGALKVGHGALFAWPPDIKPI